MRDRCLLTLTRVAQNPEGGDGAALPSKPTAQPAHRAAYSPMLRRPLFPPFSRDSPQLHTTRTHTSLPPPISRLIFIVARVACAVRKGEARNLGAPC